MWACAVPIRAQARAKLALDELKRQHGFDRSILIMITPTGTGWIDPAAMDSVEYLHDGDVASVAMQYSYLNSPLSLLFQPEYGAAGRASPVRGDLRLLDDIAEGQAAQTVSAWPEPWRHELGEIGGAVRDDRRSDRRGPVERAAVREPHLALDHREPQRRLSGLAAGIS